MNSFTLTAVGNVARNPETTVDGDTHYTRFCLVGTDYAGRDQEGTVHTIVTSIWFVACGSVGQAIAENVRKGDQLILEARVRSNVRADGSGNSQHEYAFVVQAVRFGAPAKDRCVEIDAARPDAEE